MASESGYRLWNPALGAGLKLKTKEGNRPVDKIDDSVVLGVELFEERCSIYLKLNIITIVN